MQAPDRMMCNIVRSRSVGSVVSVAALALALAACGGGSYRPANAPSETTSTGATVDTSPTAGAPAGIEPNGATVTATSPSPASPMEGACPTGEPRGGMTDRVSCLASCRGLDDAVPLGSRCLSQYADCSLKCEEKFSRP